MATLESTIRLPRDVLFRDLGGEAVLLNLENGKYYGLDDVGTRMWSLLAEHGRVERAYQALLGEYDVDEEQLLRDLLRLIDELAHNGLLQVNET